MGPSAPHVNQPHHLHSPVVVAVIIVRVVQTITDEVVGVVAMRNRLMAAAGAVLVPLAVYSTGVVGGAVVGVLRADLQAVLLDPLSARVVEMPIVQVVYVPIVFDGGVPTPVAVAVGVSFVAVLGADHEIAPHSKWGLDRACHGRSIGIPGAASILPESWPP